MSSTPAAEAPAAPKPGSPEHDAAMAAKFENRDVVADKSVEEVAPAAKPAKPEGIPDKFWNAEKGVVDVEGMAKSYAELERTRSQPKPAPAAAPASAPVVDAAKAALEAALVAVKAKPDVKPEEIAAAEKAVADYKPAAPASPKLDLSSFEEEYNETGNLSAESYTKLEALGFNKGTVDAYITGLKATEAAYEGKAFEVAGGKETYTKMTTWAATALTPAEQAAFDNVVTSGSVEQMQLAVQGLHAKFVAANGQAPQLLGNTERPSGNVVGFRDKSEMTAAMRDPRYKVSEAYRDEVAAKLMASQF